MKKRLRIIVVGGLIIILTLIYSFIDKAIPLYDTKMDTSEYRSIQLYGGDSITQSFVCKEDHLDGMAIKISSIGDQEKVFLTYQLKSGNKVLVKNETSLKGLESGKFFQIKFDQIDHCKGKKFFFSVSVSNESDTNGVNIYTTSQTDTNFVLSDDGETINETLVLRTLTHRFDFETFFVTICFILYIVFFMKWMYKLFK